MVKMLERFERALSVVLFVIILVVLLAQIFMRKLFGTPLEWSEEFSRLLFVYLGVIGCHLAQKENIHVRIDALMQSASKKTKLIIEFCINLVMTGIFIWTIFIGIKIVSNTGKQDLMVTLHLSVAYLNAALIFLGAIMAVELVSQMVNIIRKGEVVRS